MRSWWTARPRRGTSRHGVRAPRTSVGPGVVNCWARRFVRFYAPGLPRRKFRPRPKGCSAWPHDIYLLPESTAKVSWSLFGSVGTEERSLSAWLLLRGLAKLNSTRYL